ncbi:MAG: protein kinase, partial [Phycisphaerae bacterium]|nr:protein kinase [Phycisphaerae bacterium]
MTNNEATNGVTQDLPSDLDLTLTYNPYIQSTVSIAAGEKHVLEILPKSFLPKISINNNDMEGVRVDDDFLVEYQVGKGGIGRVDAAKQLCFDRMVAIKRVRSDRGSLYAEQQLEKEARIMGQLEHPAIPPVHLVGLDVEGQLSLVMKFIEGNSWHEILDRDYQKIDQHKLPQWYIEKHLNYFIRIGEALEFAHQKSI